MRPLSFSNLAANEEKDFLGPTKITKSNAQIGEASLSEDKTLVRLVHAEPRLEELRLLSRSRTDKGRPCTRGHDYRLMELRNEKGHQENSASSKSNPT